MTKIVLYQSTDLKLRQFETKYGRSLINEKYTVIERPLNIVENHPQLKFVDDYGKGFVVYPISVRNEQIRFTSETGDFVFRDGLVVETRTGKHIFYQNTTRMPTILIVG